MPKKQSKKNTGAGSGRFAEGGKKRASASRSRKTVVKATLPHGVDPGRAAIPPGSTQKKTFFAEPPLRDVGGFGFPFRRGFFGLSDESGRRFARALAGNPKVSVVVVNHNGADLLWNCLFSLRTQKYPLEQIIVVDNASTDASLSFVEANYPQAQILECQENFGYAQGCNLGARVAKGDLLAFLHNDMVATPDWISRMVETFREWGPGTGAVTSEVVRKKGKGDADQRNAINLLGLPIRAFYTDIALRFAPSAGAFMVPRHLFPEGPFEGDYFLGGEDTQLGFRFQDALQPVVFAKGAKVFHGETESAARLPGWKKEYYSFRNRYLTLLTFYRWETLVKLSPLMAVEGLFCLVKGLLFSPEKLVGTLLGIGWIGFHPGWLNKTRLEIQKKRQGGDDRVLALLSGRMGEDEGKGVRIANFLSLVYCRLVQLPILESGEG